jgi:hypothetical protein
MKLARISSKMVTNHRTVASRIRAAVLISLATFVGGTLFATAAYAHTEVPAGTHFTVQLGDKLDAKKVKPGKKFEARTLEDLETTDGTVIPAGSEVEGQVVFSEKNEMEVQFERIETPWGMEPLMASVVEVIGDEGVRELSNNQGVVKAEAKAGHSKAVAVGTTEGGGTGALIGVEDEHHKLVLHEGTRFVLELDRPLLVLPG